MTGAVTVAAVVGLLSLLAGVGPGMAPPPHERVVPVLR